VANTQRKFQSGETLLWQTVEQSGTPTHRMVGFEAYEAGGASATVQWLHNAEGQPRRWSVPVRELSRPVAPSNVPIYHQHAFKPPTPPQPLSETQITARIEAARAALAEAHEDVRRAKDVVRSTSELVSRAAKELEAARAALLSLEAHHMSEGAKLEAAIRQGQTPPEMQPAGQDRAAVVQRTQACEHALQKFQAEDRTAQQHLSETLAAVRREAVSLITARFESDCQQLHELQELALKVRADLIKVSRWWPDGSALRLSEASASLLTVIPDYDRVRFLSSEAAVTPWERLYQQLLTDPTADFVTEEEPVTAESAQAAE
jgi:hypothetical protein